MLFKVLMPANSPPKNAHRGNGALGNVSQTVILLPVVFFCFLGIWLLGAENGKKECENNSFLQSIKPLCTNKTHSEHGRQTIKKTKNRGPNKHITHKQAFMQYLKRILWKTEATFHCMTNYSVTFKGPQAK